MASDDLRAVINKYLPESVRLREQRTASRPKVRTPQGDNPLSLLPKAETVPSAVESGTEKAAPIRSIVTVRSGFGLIP